MQGDNEKPEGESSNEAPNKPAQANNSVSRLRDGALYLHALWKRNRWVRFGSLLFAIIVWPAYTYGPGAYFWFRCGGEPASPEYVVELARKGSAKELQEIRCPDLRSVKLIGGRNLLFEAAEYGNGEALQFLVDRGVNPDHMGMDGSISGTTPLIVAAKHGHARAIEVLLPKSKDSLHTDASGRSALGWAIAKDDSLSVTLLARKLDLTRPIDNRAPPLLLAIEGEKLNASNALLELKADPDQRNTRKQSSLHLAAAAGNEKAIDLLLRNGAGVRVTDSNGKSPIDVALNEPTRKMLEAYAASLTLDAFVFAQANELKRLQTAYARGANLNLVTNTGDTIFHAAAMGRAADALKWLGDQPIDNNINSKDKGGRTPLVRAIVVSYHCASDETRLAAAIKALISIGANPLVQLANGDTPLRLAISMRCPNSVLEAMLDGVRSDSGHSRALLLSVFFDAIKLYPHSEGAIHAMLSKHPGLASWRNPAGRTAGQFVNETFANTRNRERLLGLLDGRK